MKIFVAFKNSDMTEGRGPMIIDEMFMEREDAVNYIDSKPGVMGRRAKWSEEKYGDWMIKELYVNKDLQDLEDKTERDLVERAKEKLTREELGALIMRVEEVKRDMGKS